MNVAECTRALLAQIEAVPVIDAHEHLIPEAQRIADEVDALELLGNYTNGDLVAAGCPAPTVARIGDPHGDLAARWQLLAPYWPKVPVRCWRKLRLFR